MTKEFIKFVDLGDTILKVSYQIHDEKYLIDVYKESGFFKIPVCDVNDLIKLHPNNIHKKEGGNNETECCDKELKQ